MSQPHKPAATPPLQALGKDVLDALRSGEYLRAIKLLRQQPGMDLKQAKDMIDAARAQLQTMTQGYANNATQAPHAPQAPPLPELHQRPGLAPGEVPRGADSALWWIVLAVAAFAAWYLLRRGG